jgi:hypothetical protein
VDEGAVSGAVGTDWTAGQIAVVVANCRQLIDGFLAEVTRRKFLERNAGLIEFAAALRRKRPAWLSSVSHLALSRALWAPLG